MIWIDATKWFVEIDFRFFSTPSRLIVYVSLLVCVCVPLSICIYTFLFMHLSHPLSALSPSYLCLPVYLYLFI